jgi:hypothetical protein
MKTPEQVTKTKTEKFCPMCLDGDPFSTVKINGKLVFEGYHFNPNRTSGDPQVWAEYKKCWKLL